MSLELSLYRARVGLFAACSRHRRRSSTKGKDARGKFLFSLALCLHVAICMAILFSLAAVSWCERIRLAAAAVSRVSSTVAGVNTCVMSTFEALPPGITSVVYTYDRSELLLLGGDIEEDPGPLEKEDLDKFGEKWTADIMEKFQAIVHQENQKLSKEIAHLTKKVTNIESELSSLRDRLAQQD